MQESSGNYELLELLGRGGMGVVYRARHRELNRHVALKVLAQGSLSTPQELVRFRTEAESIACLDHKHIAQVYEAGTDGEFAFIAMKLIDGVTLNEWCATNHPSLRQCAEVLASIADGVHHAHQRGVIHRDIKPSNIMIDRNGEPSIVDFGLAKRIDSVDGVTVANGVTVTGQIMGSVSYMAPEQAAGDSKRVGPASDIYGLGATLFYALTQRPPFLADTYVETLQSVLNTPAPSPRSLVRAIPLDLSTICEKCLEKDPAHRYGSAAELRDDLNRFLQHVPISARRVSIPQRTYRWCNRNRLVTAFITVVTLSLILVSWLFIRASRAIADSQTSFRRQLQTVNELLVQVGSEELRNVPNAQVIRRDLLDKAAKFYDEAGINSHGQGQLDDLAIKVKIQLAATLIELSAEVTQYDDPRTTLAQAKARLQELIDRGDPNGLSLDEAMQVYCLDGNSRARWEQNREHSQSGRRTSHEIVRAIRRDALTDIQTLQMRLSVSQESRVDLGEQLVRLRSDLAEEFPHDREAQRRLAGSRQNLAEALREYAKLDTLPVEKSLHLYDEALIEIKKSRKIRHDLAAGLDKVDGKLQMEIAKGDYALAAILSARLRFLKFKAGQARNAIAQADIDEVAASYQAAVDEFQKLIDSESYSIESQRWLAVTLREKVIWLTHLEGKVGNPLKAINDLHQAVDLQKKLYQQNPKVLDYHVEYLNTASLYVTLVLMGPHARDEKAAKLNFDDVVSDVAACRRLVDTYPSQLSAAYISLVISLDSVGKLNGAESTVLQPILKDALDWTRRNRDKFAADQYEANLAYLNGLLPKTGDASHEP